MLQPDVKALVWFLIGTFVGPLILSKVRARTGR